MSQCTPHRPASPARRCADLPQSQTGGASPAHSAAVYTLRLLAGRIHQLTTEARDLEKRIRDAVTARSPRLLERVGIGPD